LLVLALARPRDAIAAARAVIEARPSPYDASIARQAAGIGLRQIGEMPAAIRELRAALRLARGSGRRDREVDVLASLGATLGRAGRGREGLDFLDQAVRGSRGRLAGRVLLRRADVYHVLGRYEEALRDLRGAVTRSRRAGDPVWEARSRGYRGLVLLALGAARRADADFAVAAQLYQSIGQEYEYAQALNNRGYAAFARGDLPTALAYIDEAGRRFQALGMPEFSNAIDRCTVLLAAGLGQEALAEADAMVTAMRPGKGQAIKKAELLLTAARAALAADDAPLALTWARQARRVFQTQDRAWWTARAHLVAVEARYVTGERSAGLLRETRELAERLYRLRTGEAPRAYLLAGRVALARGDVAQADGQLVRAARSRHRGRPLERSAAWLAHALRCDARGLPVAAVHACGRGLDALDEHRTTLGATELRAHATIHGAELAGLALRDALRRDDARRLLRWSERWRATALAVAPVRPADDEELVAELAALRDVVRRLDAAVLAGTGVDRQAVLLQHERVRLERAVRARTLRTRGTGAATAPGFDVDDLVAGLGEVQLIELVDVDEALHAVVVHRGRIRRHPVGRLAEAEREVELARFRLRGLAHRRPSAGAGPSLRQVGERLERVLLGSAAPALGPGPVVIVPPGRLHAVPWALLPSLADRPVSVAPSAAIWLQVSRRQPPAGRDVVLAFGPDLGTGPAEIPPLATMYQGATVLGGGSATVERVLAALDGAWLAHIAAHGTFRADSPMFSALRLDDGPLTVHDLERLGRAPYRLILSSCDAGLAKPVGADELLGLTTGLVPLGAAGILASVVPVNDVSAVPVMLAVHDGLRGGGTLAEALWRARADLDGDLLAHATAASFVALGV
jgi:tetratricopeptide (TPR) repeat protein